MFYLKENPSMSRTSLRYDEYQPMVWWVQGIGIKFSLKILIYLVVL
jgi:hypothetical protein